MTEEVSEGRQEMRAGSEDRVLQTAGHIREWNWKWKTIRAKCFKGGAQYPVDNAPVWTYVAKDGLKAPGVAVVEQFRKAVEESEKVAAQKQKQQ